ncbi:hypothetical protein GNAINCEL_00113 [Serratia phage KKP 3709]|nr:hypothetical protein GNAINCEL_00113 [Serratia phage KKP 3709]
MPTNIKATGKFTIPIVIHKLRAQAERAIIQRQERLAKYLVSADGIRFHKKNGLQVGDWPAAQFEYRNSDEQQRVD